MKYSDANPPLQCIMYDNFCYQRNIQTQPSKDETDREEIGGYNHDYNPKCSQAKKYLIGFVIDPMKRTKKKTVD